MTIADKLSTRILNASTEMQQSDRFNVRFLGIPENLSDFLSRQVKMITPATISFGVMTHANRRASFSDIGKIEPEMVSVVMNSDDQGIAESIVLSQIFRQKGMDVSGFAERQDRKFDISLEYYDVRGEMNRSEVYRNCYIKTFVRSDYEVTTGTPMIFTLSIEYDSIDFSLEGETFPLS